MPRTIPQAFGFLLGFWLVLWLSPLRVEIARAEGSHSALEAALHDSVNGVRTGQHLMALERRPDLDAVALAHAEDMVRRSYMAHESPEGANPLDRLYRGGVEGFALAAENIGYTTRGDPNREIITHWLHSPIHRKNLLAPIFNATGIGIAQAADGALIYTQVYVTYPR
jgi:uncharacterized protein YkwD